MDRQIESKRESDGPLPTVEFFLKRFGSFIAWFSGAAAGISALVYIFGFIAYKSAYRLLGISSDFATRDAYLIIARGSSISARTAIVAAVGVLVVIATTWLCGRLGRLLSRVRGGGVLRRLEGLAVPLGAFTMFASAVIALTFIAMPSYEVRGLLFLSDGAAHEIQAKAIADAAELQQQDFPSDTIGLFEAAFGAIEYGLKTQDVDFLSGLYNIYAFLFGVILGIGIRIWPGLVRARRRFWMVMAGISVVVTTLYVPILYGVLAAEKRAPKVVIHPEASTDHGRMRLLSRDSNGILVWLECERQILWIAKSEYTKLEISDDRPILLDADNCSEQEILAGDAEAASTNGGDQEE